jgi:hypothetical protein
MWAITSRNSNRSETTGREDAIQRRRTGLKAAGDRVKKAATKAGLAIARFMEALAEARMHRAAIEAELYRGRYKHSSKNDDDLPIVR